MPKKFVCQRCGICCIQGPCDLGKIKEKEKVCKYLLIHTDFTTSCEFMINPSFMRRGTKRRFRKYIKTRPRSFQNILPILPKDIAGNQCALEEVIERRSFGKSFIEYWKKREMAIKKELIKLRGITKK